MRTISSRYSIAAAFVGGIAVISTGLALTDSKAGAGGSYVRRAPATSVVASGLNNPRGLNFAPDGSLYVAEAGTGGSISCAPDTDGRCYGRTASIARIDLRSGAMVRVLTGLPSLAPPDGNSAEGVHDVSPHGLGGIYFTVGFGGNPANRVAYFGPDGQNLARIGRITGHSYSGLHEDIGIFELQNNPTGDEIDTNPYGMLSLPGRRVVADAGANDLVEIASNGSIRALAEFPDRVVSPPEILGFPPDTMLPADEVPTSVALGPDGNYYVGQLVGFPFPVDQANVYRVSPNGGPPEIAANGFTAVVDVTFGPDGSMYVVEMAKNGLLAGFILGDWTGALMRVEPDGTRTELATGLLTAPGGVAVGPDGAVYVTNKSTSGGDGEILRIEL